MTGHGDPLSTAGPDEGGLAALEALALAHQRRGDRAGERDAWARLVGIDPSHHGARKRLKLLLGEATDDAEAIAILRVFVAADPGNPHIWRNLARRLMRVGDLAAAVEAWRRTLDLAELAEAHDQLGAALIGLGRTAEAEPHLRAAAEASDDPAAARRLALHYAGVGDLQAEAQAWRRALATGGPDLMIEERLARLGWRSRPRQAPRALKIAVIGNCQALGVAQCLRRLAPDAEVLGISYAHLTDAQTASRVLAGVEDCDIVAAQSGQPPFFGEELAALGARLGQRLSALPRIHFTGFHPDILRLPADRLPPAARRLVPLGAYHSALAMAAFAMGLGETRAQELFNAYIYAALGYFDEYAKASEFNLREGRSLGVDLGPALARWRAQGVFMHTPNHPTVQVFWSLAQVIAERAGAAPQTETQAEPPTDALAAGIRWPVYPEIARRLGAPGGLVFESGWAKRARTLDLPAMIAAFYQAYQTVGPAWFMALPRVSATGAALRREGV